MTIEIKRQITRYRCDHCRKLVHWLTEPIVIHDTPTGKTYHACNREHAAQWFHKKYQVKLNFNPCSNTGVNINLTAEKCDDCILDCQEESHCINGAAR